MNDPLGFFLTWTTYGTWLPGDQRGWVEYHHGWQFPRLARELEAAARMTENACRLNEPQRTAVERQIHETCCHRGWHLHAVNCRSNHIHVVVTATETDPKKLRSDLKAWATRCLKHEREATRNNWWSERGSIRYLYNEESLHAAIRYVVEGQDSQ
jgi:REP element-mobilizing transposase RayT